MKNATFPIAALMALSIFASACKGQTNKTSTEQTVRIVGGGCEAGAVLVLWRRAQTKLSRQRKGV
jgi:hypothetical protein